MASNLLAMASNLLISDGLQSTVIVMASNLTAMASNLLASFLFVMNNNLQESIL